MDALWVLFTLIAAGAQTARNAMQRELIGALGAVGASQVRFLFGLPFAALFLILVEWALHAPTPSLTFTTFAWIALGALAQVAATALMLAAMRRRSFVVVVAFTKTEAAQVALFSLLFLGERPTPALMVSIALATIGVFLVSARGVAQAGSARAAIEGLVSAAFFAIAAIAFRQAIIKTDAQSFVLAATFTLAVGLLVQTGALMVWLVAFDRSGLAAIVKAWRGSLVAGFMGAFASQFWFLGFAVAEPSRVRTLALIEVLFAQGVGVAFFGERPTPREAAGMALILVGTILLING